MNILAADFPTNVQFESIEEKKLFKDSLLGKDFAVVHEKDESSLLISIGYDYRTKLAEFISR